jgi:hypothetical protein
LRKAVAGRGPVSWCSLITQTPCWLLGTVSSSVPTADARGIQQHVWHHTAAASTSSPAPPTYTKPRLPWHTVDGVGCHFHDACGANSVNSTCGQ